jgi:hypothetical protein
MGQRPIASVDLCIEKFEEPVADGGRSPTALTTYRSAFKNRLLGPAQVSITQDV